MDILFVDDNAEYLALVKEVLFSKGYTVHAAHDGVEGCTLLASNDIDLVISDIKMPRLDGIKLHAFTRELARYRDTKFVFISAYPDAINDVKPMDPNKDFFLDKTTPLQDILKFINSLLFGKYEGSWI